MNLDDDDDSVFEQALRADLPSLAEQNRLRQRILAAGVAAGTALGSANVAASAQASLGASALSKLSALSWPAKVGLAAALAAPIAGVALPRVYAPVRGAALVSQVRSSAATVHAQAATKAALPGASSAPSLALEAPPARQAEPEPEPALAPVQANVASRASLVLPTPVAANPNPSQAANSKAVVAEPAVAAFGAVAHDATASEAERLRNASTLAAETQLLDRAFAALAAGDRSTASALVAEHARRFPNGLLRQERERARARLAQDPKGE